jgi:hypothetical protein
MNSCSLKIIPACVIAVLGIIDSASSQMLNPYEPRNATAAEPGHPYCLLQPAAVRADYACPNLVCTQVPPDSIVPLSAISRRLRGSNELPLQIPPIDVFPTPFKW